jgi:multiple sugar transport system permease protein
MTELKAATPKRRVADDPNAVPIHLYGMKRGTVTFLTVLSALFALFTLLPVVWIAINSTKDQNSLFNSFGYWFSRPFDFWHNLKLLDQDVDGDGTYTRWLVNTAIYAVAGGVGATILSALAGYGFARFQFRGVKALFFFVISALLIPLTAISLPLYLVYAKVHLVNSIWGMILPSMVTPVGVYLMRTFIGAAVPQELLDAARVDGAGEVRIFFRLALPLMVPGLMTVLLLSVVGVWNNYFLPLLIFSRNNLYPLTVGIGIWAQRAQASGDQLLFPLVVIGGLVTIVPLIALFLVMQRYWKGGMLVGSFAN